MKLDHISALKGLCLCLRAGNEVFLMPRTKKSNPIRIVEARKTYVKPTAIRGLGLHDPTKLQVKTEDGRWIDIIAGDRLNQQCKYGAEWEL